MAENITIYTDFVGRDMMGPALGQISGQLTNVGRTMENTGRRGAASANMLTREWETFQRHLRYAVAGFGTYEIFNAIGRLRDYQNELGNLNSTLNTTPQALGEFGRAAIDISLKTATPLNDVLQSMNNIATSIPNLSAATRQHLIPAMADIEAMGSRISGIDPRSFGATIMGLASAFVPRNLLMNQRTGPVQIEKVARQVLELQRRIPNPAGAQALYSALPMLAGGAFTGDFTLTQALGMFAVAQRIIQRPQTTAQYLRQLMIRIHAPAKQAQTYFNQAGLTPDVLAKLSGPEILNTILLHALALPGANLHGMTPEQFIKTGSWQRLEVKDQAATYIQKTIGGRIQSLVAARALVAGVQQLPQEERALKEAVSVQTRFNRAIQQMPMQQAQQAISDMTTSLTLNFEPGINAASRGMIELAKWSISGSKALQRVHNFVEKHLGGGGLGAFGGGAAEIGIMAGTGLVARGIFKGLFSAREGAQMSRASGLLRRVPGLGRLLGRGTSLEQITGAPLLAARPMAEAMAAQNALTGTVNGTMDAPFWVVLHPLTMSQIPALSGKEPIGGTGGGGGTAAGEGAAGATLAARLRKFLATRAAANAIGGGLSGLEMGGGGLAITAVLASAGATGQASRSVQQALTRARGFPALSRNLSLLRTQELGTIGSGVDPILKAFMAGHLGGAQAEALLSFSTALGGHQIPRGLQPYFDRFQRGKISAGQLDQAINHYARQTAVSVARHGGHANTLQQAILGMFRLTQGHQLRLSRVDRRDAAQGYVEATLNLEPTQEFANLLQPQQVKVHIPIGQAQPAPKSRARRGTRTK